MTTVPLVVNLFLLATYLGSLRPRLTKLGQTQKTEMSQRFRELSVLLLSIGAARALIFSFQREGSWTTSLFLSVLLSIHVAFPWQRHYLSKSMLYLDIFSISYVIFIPWYLESVGELTLERFPEIPVEYSRFLSLDTALPLLHFYCFRSSAVTWGLMAHHLFCSVRWIWRSDIALGNALDVTHLLFSLWILEIFLLYSFIQTQNSLNLALRVRADFFRQLSHDIRTPLAALISWLDELKPHTVPAQTEAYEIARGCAHTIKSISDGLLDVFQSHHKRLFLREEPINLYQLEKMLIGVLNVVARARDIQLLKGTGWPDIDVIADAARIQQIVWNIVTNAIKFSPQGSVVELDFTSSVPASEDEKVEVGCRVRDHGQGIPPEDLGRIFLPNVSLNTPYFSFGLGMGLAICSELSALMGGKLTASSELGRGSTFNFTVKLRRSTEPKKPPSPAVVRRSRSLDAEEANIVVADDNSLNRTLVARWLRDDGYRVFAARNGQEVLELVTPGTFLIFMDLQMPVMDGETATQRLRADGSTVPIVALTDPSLKAEALQAGFTDFISKPVSREALREIIFRFTPSS